MAVTRACANCGRLQTIAGEGCCGTCYKAGKGLSGEAKAEALAAVKARIEGGGVKRRGNTGPRKAAKKDPVATSAVGETKRMSKAKIAKVKVHLFSALAEKFAPDRVVEDVQVISIEFPEERDRKIYDALIGQAARLRRTPEQQILWMLQNAMEQETGLLAAASGR